MTMSDWKDFIYRPVSSSSFTNDKTWTIPYPNGFDFTFERTEPVGIHNATYRAEYMNTKNGKWEYKKAKLDDGDPYLWVIRASEEEPEAGVCMAFDVGKFQVSIVITLTSLLQMAKAVVEQQGHELYYGVDTSVAAFGDKAKGE